jgi:hypothetical protein
VKLEQSYMICINYTESDGHVERQFLMRQCRMNEIFYCISRD